jgi:hypothetical protein
MGAVLVLLGSGMLYMCGQAEFGSLERSQLARLCAVFVAVGIAFDARNLWHMIGEARPDPRPTRQLDFALRGEGLLIGALAAILWTLPWLQGVVWIFGPQVVLYWFLRATVDQYIGTAFAGAGISLLATGLLAWMWEGRHGRRLVAPDGERLWYREFSPE